MSVDTLAPSVEVSSSARKAAAATSRNFYLVHHLAHKLVRQLAPAPAFGRRHFARLLGPAVEGGVDKGSVHEDH